MINGSNNGTNGGHSANDTTRGGLISYLAKLGLGDDQLADIVSLMQVIHGEKRPSPSQDVNGEPNLADFLQVMRGEDLLKKPYSGRDSFDTAFPQHPVEKTAPPKVKLYFAEDQQILREAFRDFFSVQSTLEVLGSSHDTSPEAVMEAAREHKPNVFILGVKTVEPSTVETLELLREENPDMAVALLFAFYDFQAIKALRRFSLDSGAGCAYLLKHTIDTADQLVKVVHAVAEGRVIIDPTVMDGLVREDSGQTRLLSELTPRELEVLSWMARGYRNDTIADVLGCDVRTVERHINKIYGKLGNSLFEGGDDTRDPRVRATLTYLKATGVLPSEQLAEG